MPSGIPEAFNTLWKAQHLENAEGAIAHDATITARTLARIAPAPAASPSLSGATLPPLPNLSLDLSDPIESRETPVAQVETRDLRVLSVLGEGGMGRVLLAHQRSLRRDVAIKTLRLDHQESDAAEALLREGVLAGSLEHPSIIPVHALGRDAQGAPVLVMKRVEGASWRTVLRSHDHPYWKRLLETTDDRLVASIMVLMEVSAAVQFAHTRGIVHRDIKPENVMLGVHGEVYLVDWGIATTLNRDGSQTQHAIRGTPAYMAPEMISGEEPIDQRTDVYLLGASLHEVLTGAPRHRGATLQMVMVSAFLSEPFAYSHEVPVELAALCHASMHRDPARRPATALDFRLRLADYLRHRASRALSTEAHACLSALRSAIERRADNVQTLGIECRFAFAQSLREWADNPHAREGLRDCLRALFTHAVQTEDLVSARALIAELGEDPASRRELKSLAQKTQRRESEAEQGRKHAAEADMKIAQHDRSRLAFGMVFTSGLLFLSSVLFEWRGHVQTHREIAVESLAAFTVFLALVAYGRKELFRNRINRLVVGVFGLLEGMMLLRRFFVLTLAAPPSVADILTVELWTSAIAIAIIAMTVRRWLLWMAPPMLIGSLVLPYMPEHAASVFGMSLQCSVAMGAYFLRRTDLDTEDTP